MDFYTSWEESKLKGLDDSHYIRSFLSATPDSLSPLVSGEVNQVEMAYHILSLIPIEHFFAVLKSVEIERQIQPQDVPCFSSFENGAARLNELLEFETDGLSFPDAGYQLINATSEGARTKYGENHSKLASMMSLVSITYHHRALIKPTSFGSYLTRFEMADKKSALQKLLLRDVCVKTIVRAALNGQVRYRDAVSNLSTSTAYRRRTNVRFLIEYVLGGTECEDALSRIDWECN